MADPVQHSAAAGNADRGSIPGCIAALPGIAALNSHHHLPGNGTIPVSAKGAPGTGTIC